VQFRRVEGHEFRKNDNFFCLEAGEPKGLKELKPRCRMDVGKRKEVS
jgi:hypothetical protein